MQFTELTIDGFGVWSGLEIRGLAPGLSFAAPPDEPSSQPVEECERALP